MKTIRIDNTTWTSLYNMKIMNNEKSLNDVICKLLSKEMK